jgi:two-component system, cell cycle response regulator CpdR
MPPSLYTILFVEDDTIVRESTAALLATSGFCLLIATDGYEAMRLAAQNHVDVLFTDIVMFGMNGIELAKQAKLLQPDLKVMFMTGYYSRAAEAAKLGRLLLKPLRGAQIESELGNLLAAT